MDHLCSMQGRVVECGITWVELYFDFQLRFGKSPVVRHQLRETTYHDEVQCFRGMCMELVRDALHPEVAPLFACTRRPFS
eukprot:5488008-Alexandrium_andersonii.AAC.1